MAGKGNQKGSNGGGGRIKGQRNGETKWQALERMGVEVVTTAAQDARIRQATKTAPTTTKAVTSQKLGKDILQEGANYFFGLAAFYQPSADNVNANEAKFEKYLNTACDIAAKVAPYQSQRLASLTVTQVPMDLSKLSNEELEQLERLHAKATVAGGDTGGASAQVH